MGRQQLESYRNSRSFPHGLVRRAEIVLLAAEGWPNDAISSDGQRHYHYCFFGRYRRYRVETEVSADDGVQGDIECDRKLSEGPTKGGNCPRRARYPVVGA